MTRWWLVRSVVLPVAALVVAGGCGASGGSGGVASLAGEGGATSTTEKRRDVDPEQAAVEFASCMREHGIDMPDPEVRDGPGGGARFGFRVGGGEGGAGGGLAGPDAEEMEKAHEECGHLLEEAGPQLTPEQQDELQDAMVAFARCMRENGIDMPDPRPGGGGIVVARPEAAQAVDATDDRFQAAEKKCRPHMAAAEQRLGIETERSEG